VGVEGSGHWRRVNNSGNGSLKGKLVRLSRGGKKRRPKKKIWVWISDDMTARRYFTGERKRTLRGQKGRINKKNDGKERKKRSGEFKITSN